MNQPSSVAIMAQPPISALPEPSRLRRWERLWTRGLISAPPHDVIFSVIALIQVSREESWGRKLPKPAHHWETPQRHIAGNERRAAVLRTRAILNWEQFRRLQIETRAKAQEWLELDDPAAEFKATDFLMVPTLAARALHLYYSGDPAGTYYGRYFAVPFHKDWMGSQDAPDSILLRQSLLTEELRWEFGETA